MSKTLKPRRKTISFCEDYFSRVGPASVDQEQGFIKGVKILGLESDNGRRYTLAALRKAVPLAGNVFPHEKRAVDTEVQQGLPQPSGGRIPLHISTTRPARCSASIRSTIRRCGTQWLVWVMKRIGIRSSIAARPEDETCPSEARCNESKDHGLVVCIPCELDLRPFPPLSRASIQCERLYKGRTAVERGKKAQDGEGAAAAEAGSVGGSMPGRRIEQIWTEV